MNNKYCIIMAGGVGSRFWPVSRRNLPKQFLDIMGTGKSFIRHTFERFLPIIPQENFLVVTNAAYKSLVLEHIPELKSSQVLCEPVGRNTAPCIAYAAYRLKAVNPQAEVVVAPSDHFIFDEETFRKDITDCLEFVADKDVLMTIGIKPSRPDTGYGYIQAGSTDVMGPVASFREKPNLEVAISYLASGNYLWNAGIFIWSNQAILKALNICVPEISALFNAQQKAFNTPEEGTVIQTIYAGCPSISIDYGVMEKADNVYVRKCDFGWNDVGTWGSLYQLSAKDEKANATQGNVRLYNSSGCMVKAPAEKMVVIDSLSDYIIADTPDALMICPMKNEQHIKQVLEDLKTVEKGKYI